MHTRFRRSKRAITAASDGDRAAAWAGHTAALDKRARSDTTGVASASRWEEKAAAAARSATP